MDAALPLAKTRRLKPPPPSFWRALALVCCDVLLGAINGMYALAGEIINGTGAAVIVAVLVALDWPRFRRELDAWLDS